MRRRPIPKFRPDLERFEDKRLLSAVASTTPVGVATLKGGTASTALHPAAASGARDGSRPVTPPHPGRGTAGIGFLGFRVTQKPYPLVPPFPHVLVQATKPIPGQVYNVLYVALRNGTNQTFNASSGFTVRIPGFTGTHRVADKGFPILTGDQQWKPGQVMVFYILGKEYYPMSPQVAAGFQFNLGGRSTTLIPGPSAIFLRLTYNPATFDRTLDWIVAYGQGAQLGTGPKFGMPDTAINTFVSAGTHRIDYGGHF
jgi:hypothetical protein